jgi:hypothetical protein
VIKEGLVEGGGNFFRKGMDLLLVWGGNETVAWEFEKRVRMEKEM